MTRFQGNPSAKPMIAQLPIGNAGFAPLVPEYHLRAYLWLALHAYRRLAAGPDMIAAVAVHIEKTCGTLTSLLPSFERVSGENSPHVKKAKATATRSTKARSGKKGSTEATKSRGTRKAPLNPVTPRPKKGRLFYEYCPGGHSRLIRPCSEPCELS